MAQGSEVVQISCSSLVVQKLLVSASENCKMQSKKQNNSTILASWPKAPFRGSRFTKQAPFSQVSINKSNYPAVKLCGSVPT